MRYNLNKRICSCIVYSSCFNKVVLGFNFYLQLNLVSGSFLLFDELAILPESLLELCPIGIVHCTQAIGLAVFEQADIFGAVLVVQSSCSRVLIVLDFAFVFLVSILVEHNHLTL